MKKLKFSIAIIICIMMVTPILTVSAHDLVSNVEWGTPVIDGVRDDVWNNAQMFEVKNFEACPNIPDDLKSAAKVWTLWDGEFLYIYGEVYDSLIDAESGHMPIYNQDTFFMGLDYTYMREPNVYYYDGLSEDEMYAGCMSIRAVPGRDDFYIDATTIFGLESYSRKITSFVAMTDYGYVVEARLPLFYKDKIFKPGDKIGFEIYMCNSIGGLALAGVTSWGPDGSNAWQYTGSFGTLILNEQQIVIIEEETAADTADTVTTAPTAPVVSPQTGEASALILIIILSLSIIILLKRKGKVL